MTLKPLPSALRQTIGQQQQHFQVLAPVATHRMQANCAEVECAHHVQGWQTIVPVGSEQELFLDHMTNRKYAKRIDGESAVFIFYPGQTCFRQHTKPLFRPPILMHRQAWNGQRRVMGLNEWHDKFATTLEGFKQERG